MRCRGHLVVSWRGWRPHRSPAPIVWWLCPGGRAHPGGPWCSLHRYSDHTMWTAFLGLHDQSKRNAPGVQERKLKRIISHPFFNDFTYDYDIAVLELEQPVEYSSTVRPICLPAASHSFPAGKAIWVTGWGHTYEGGEQASSPTPPPSPTVSRRMRLSGRKWRLLVKVGVRRLGL